MPPSAPVLACCTLPIFSPAVCLFCCGQLVHFTGDASRIKQALPPQVACGVGPGKSHAASDPPRSVPLAAPNPCRAAPPPALFASPLVTASHHAMMQPPPGLGGPPGGPGVNSLPTPRATLKVSNIPSFVTGDDFSRLMLQLEGCVEARLLGRCAPLAGGLPAVRRVRDATSASLERH